MSYLTTNPAHFNLKIAGANLTIFHPSFFDEKSDSWKVLSDTNPLPVTLSERTALTKALADLYKESTDTLTTTKQLNTLISQMKLLATGPKGEQGEFGTSDIATQTEAKTGTSNTKLMTPLRTKDYVNSRIATKTQAELGQSNDAIMTPSLVLDSINKNSIVLAETEEGGEAISRRYSDGTSITIVRINLGPTTFGGSLGAGPPRTSTRRALTYPLSFDKVESVQITASSEGNPSYMERMVSANYSTASETSLREIQAFNLVGEDVTTDIVVNITITGRWK